MARYHSIRPHRDSFDRRVSSLVLQMIDQRDIQISELKQKLLDKSDAVCLEADERDQWQRAAFEQQNLREQLEKELAAAQDMLEQAVARNEKLENENASLRAALEHAANVFQRYGEQHAAKMTMSASSKALNNYAEAQTCRNVLAI